MRKVSFFNRKNKLLMWLLVWGLLFDKSLEISKQSLQETAAEDEKDEIKKKDEVQKKKPLQPNKNDGSEPCIRVLLMTTGYESYSHSEVSGVCDGEEFLYTPESPELTKKPLILDGGKEGITVKSIERQCGQPVYYGTLEIIKNGQELNVINEVPLETYLESVVPSEMPSSYEPQALMAQAVCARTYAWKHMEGNGIKGYDADVDDSVNYQVYGNILPQESTTKAVNETKSLILCQNGEPVDTYYFSTSAGVTSTDEVWGAEKSAPYLKSVACTFDEESPWSQWDVTIPWDNIEKNAERLAGTDCTLSGVIIQKKSQSGAVIGLQVNTDKGTHLVETEYDVREFLSPEGCMIQEKDGSLVQGGILLPSAYFSFEEYPGEKIVITGGGYGHGVGMSQNGANQMAAEGYTFEEILAYFFKDTELKAAVCG